MFDNRRVQHAREPFDTRSGRRLFRGCYVNSDDIYSKLRVLNRRAQGKRADPGMSGVFITCAITGSGDTTSKSDLVPITPSADSRSGHRRR